MTTTIAAVRGAISVRANRAADIREATARLLETMIRRNSVTADKVVSAVFTATPDLTADFPAHAARRLGWTDVPLLGAVELAVPSAPKRIVRVLLTLRGVPRGVKLIPIYLDEAAGLRPDLASGAKKATANARARPMRRIALIGLGQIGGSLGLALEVAGGWHRVGFDVRPAARREAHAKAAIDEIASTLERACHGADIAVVAVPVDVLPGALDRAAAALPERAVLLDTGSARRGVTEALVRASVRVRAVGGHPIAGNERRGLAGASAQLFHAAPFALLPVRGGVPPVVRALLRDIGAEPRVVTPGEHDAALARTSHLPWLVSRALARLGGAAAKRKLAGPGFASMTRLAASDPRIPRAYTRANATNVRQAWRALRAEIDREVRGL
jgi:monofunctional chorismate mutase